MVIGQFTCQQSKAITGNVENQFITENGHQVAKIGSGRQQIIIINFN